MQEAIRLYCGIGETTFNHHPVAPGPYACVSPVCGSTERTKSMTRVSVPPGVLVLQDSGAFSDGPADRLRFEEALERQIAHAERFGYEGQIEARASYDCLLIDEIWENGMRRKERWPEEAGEIAVQTSVQAAAFLSYHRDGLPVVLSAQGVTPEQYMRCAQQIVPFLEPWDIFGLGGWCILGKMPRRMMPVFRQAMHTVIPFLGRVGVRRVHIWGVCYAPALGELLYLCDQWGIELSTDSAAPSIRPVMGSWGYSSWRMSGYEIPPVLESCRTRDEGGQKSPSCLPGTCCRGLERSRHVELTRDWLAHIREREARFYRWVEPCQQLSFLEVL